jgi:hypothetical protein
MHDSDRTASLMSPAKLAQLKPRPPASPAAWLDQMASDVGHAHVRRLAQLRDDLQDETRECDFAPLAAGLHQVAQALPRLDFGLLRPRSWVARVMGNGRNTGEDFAERFEQVNELVRALSDQTQALAARQQQQAASTDRMLLEFEVEFRAIDKIVEQGARWLQDMRNQLDSRESQLEDEAQRQQFEREVSRCDLLVERLNSLRAVSAASQQAYHHARATFSRRAALLAMLQQAMAADVRQWRAQVSAVARAQPDAALADEKLESPMASHRDLQLCVKQGLADWTQLQLQERTLAEQMDAAAAGLQAAC